MFSRFLVAGSLAANALAINILLTNDDSWASANIRATYTALKADGHDVLLVGPAVQQSGKGGTFVVPTVNITAPGGEFGSIAVGAPYFGQDGINKDFWYFNGTPAAAAAWGLDVIAPIHFGKPGNKSVDLVVSGPNEGWNLGPFLYTLSGTIGATYFAVERGVPAVAFSAGNSTHRSFSTNTGAKDDPANLAGAVVAKLVKGLAAGVNTKKGDRILPLGVGINSNIPTFGPGSNCTEPSFVQTRMTGGAFSTVLSVNPATGLPAANQNAVVPGLNTCLNGICQLPGETPVVQSCHTSVSVFTTDYDASVLVAAPIQARLLPISTFFNP